MRSSVADIPTRLRAVFISDVHLGSKDCRADELLQFLASVEVDYLYLVGDIIDFWSLRRNLYWPRQHGEVLRAILAKARAGAQVTYIPGNHDEDMREFCGSMFGNLQIRRQHVHTTADGRELLVMHGDEFDATVKCSRWLAWLGSGAYAFTLLLNRIVNLVRRMLGLPHWSLAQFLKLRLGHAARYMEAFERAAAHVAAREAVDGIVCGHIHRAAMRDIGGVLYCNDGDWVESCTAMVEDSNGHMSLWSWAEARQRVAREKLVEAAA